MAHFSHLNEHGEATMVDVSAKLTMAREAKVTGQVTISRECLAALSEEALREIKTTARIAGIQAAKKTADLIPMCHQIPLSQADVSITLDQTACAFIIEARARTQATTGVEMEVLTAANICALTIYDMIKGNNPEAVIGPFQLVEKKGGKSGLWTRPQEN